MRTRCARLACLTLLWSCVGGCIAQVIHLNANRKSSNQEIQRLVDFHSTYDEGMGQGVTLKSQDKIASSVTAEIAMHTGEGTHTIEAKVGGQTRELIIDTGSGKTAFICSSCSSCGMHANPPYRMSSTGSYVTCSITDQTDQEECSVCKDSKCIYEQKYVEGDFWQAYKMTDIMSLGNHPVLSSPIDFGCIFKANGAFENSDSDGIIGLSRHHDSIFEQFYRHKVTKNRMFSQCLSRTGGTFVLGGVDLSLNTTEIRYTPTREYGHQYWAVWLEGITVGGKHVDVSNKILNAKRGCVLDSGSTFIYLPSAVKQPLTSAWTQAFGSSDNVPFGGTKYHITANKLKSMPAICFNFQNGVSLCVKPDEYMFQLSSNTFAGTLFFNDDVKTTLIGANALADHNIVYDIENSRIGIAQAVCDSIITRASAVNLSDDPGGDTFESAFDTETFMENVAAWIVMVAAGIILNVAFNRVILLREDSRTEQCEHDEGEVEGHFVLQSDSYDG